MLKPPRGSRNQTFFCGFPWFACFAWLSWFPWSARFVFRFLRTFFSVVGVVVVFLQKQKKLLFLSQMPWVVSNLLI